MPAPTRFHWDYEAKWAVQEWSARFDAERREAMNVSGASNSGATWVRISNSAKRTFETVSDELLQRVRIVLAARRSAEQIGSAESAATALAKPLIKAALAAVPNADQVARTHGFSSPNMLKGPLELASRAIERRGAAFEAAISNEVSIRLSEIVEDARTTERRVESSVLGDFVLLSKAALENGNKDVASVLAAAALEDCLKRFAVRHGISVDGPSMQDIVGALKSKGLVSGAHKTMLDTMPKLRDYAMHANWSKVDGPSVNAMIGFVEQFLADNFS